MGHVVIWLLIAWLAYKAVKVVSFIRRSRRLRDEYRLAHHDRRRELEAAWQDDPQLAAHMRPLNAREVCIALSGVAVLLALALLAAFLRAV